jgi:hypothetical protein
MDENLKERDREAKRNLMHNSPSSREQREAARRPPTPAAELGRKQADEVGDLKSKHLRERQDLDHKSASCDELLEAYRAPLLRRYMKLLVSPYTRRQRVDEAPSLCATAYSQLSFEQLHCSSVNGWVWGRHLRSPFAKLCIVK